MKSSSESQPSSPVAQAEAGKEQSLPGEVQERGLTDLIIPPGPLPQFTIQMSPLPGYYAIQTVKRGNSVTAVSGGGRATEPVFQTDFVHIGAWEKFRLYGGNPSNPQYKAIQTATNNFVTAVNGGGLTTNAFRTNVLGINTWELFRLVPASGGLSYAIQTSNAHFVTAVGGGGTPINFADALHTDATKVKEWEIFNVVKCGDLGDGLLYRLFGRFANISSGYSYLNALGGGGKSTYPVNQVHQGPQDPITTVWRLIKQPNGWYALQTPNGVNYLTAIGGGGLRQDTVTKKPEVFATDRTVVDVWERFRFDEQENCEYLITTSAGPYIGGIYEGWTGAPLSAAMRWRLHPVGL
jgi:hypothetical protein